MTDLTDRYNEICDELEGPTLEEQWEENPEPEVGAPSGQTILEELSDKVYVWNTTNYKSTIEYTGPTMDIER